MSDARVIRADRAQLRWEMVDLEALLAPDHRARIVWSFVETLDLTALYDEIGAREGEAGRPAADPAVLMALWLYATVEGVGSARELARLVERDVAYRWLAGGVPVNYHGLADFRVDHGVVLDRLLSESVTALIAERLVSLDEIALDGTKVRASAGRGSYAGRKRLVRIEEAVERRIAALKQELDSDPEASSRRKRAARERAARETQDRAAKARAALERLQAEKERRRKKHPADEARKNTEAEVSITDPDARRMRFADGAVRAGYNIQIAAHPISTIVVRSLRPTGATTVRSRSRWWTTSRGAMAAHRVVFWSTPITPGVTIWSRWRRTKTALSRFTLRRRSSVTRLLSSPTAGRAVPACGTANPSPSSNGGRAWRAPRARRSSGGASGSNSSMPSRRTAASAS